jgi:hypothetical protein
MNVEDSLFATHAARSLNRVGELHHRLPRCLARVRVSAVHPVRQPFKNGVV